MYLLYLISKYDLNVYLRKNKKMYRFKVAQTYSFAFNSSLKIAFFLQNYFLIRLLTEETLEELMILLMQNVGLESMQRVKSLLLLTLEASIPFADASDKHPCVEVNHFKYFFQIVLSRQICIKTVFLAVTVSGAECRFPFEVNAIIYSTCVYMDSVSGPKCETSGWNAAEPTYSECISTLEGKSSAILSSISLLFLKLV